MELSKAVMGAIIGAALGIVLLVLIHPWADGVWLAIPVAILTGVGARVMVATKGHPSYARGAITGALALVAYLSGSFLVAEIAVRRAAEPVVRDVAAAAERPAGAPDAREDAAETPLVAAPPEQPPPLERRNRVVVHRPPRPWVAWDFLWLSVAVLVAYELGRGTGTPAGSALGTGESTADPALARDGEPAPTPPEVIRPPD